MDLEIEDHYLRQNSMGNFTHAQFFLFIKENSSKRAKYFYPYYFRKLNLEFVWFYFSNENLSDETRDSLFHCARSGLILLTNLEFEFNF